MKKPQSIWNSSLGTHWVHGAHVKLCCTVFSSIYAWLAGQFMHRPCLKVSQFVVRLSLHWSAGQSNWTACMTRCVDSHAACMTCMKFLAPKAKEGQRFKVQSPLLFHVSALFCHARGCASFWVWFFSIGEKQQARPHGRATGSAEQGPQFGGAPNTRSAAY